MKKDKIIGIGAIITAVFFFYHTQTVTIPENIAEPGPRSVPYIAQALMIVCGVGIIVESMKNEEKTFLSKEGWKKLLMAYAILFLYAIGLTFLGFILVTPFMIFIAITMLSGKKKISFLKRGIVSVGVTLSLYLIFSQAFGVMLPQGIL